MSLLHSEKERNDNTNGSFLPVPVEAGVEAISDSEVQYIVIIVMKMYIMSKRENQ